MGSNRNSLTKELAEETAAMLQRMTGDVCLVNMDLSIERHDPSGKEVICVSEEEESDYAVASTRRARKARSEGLPRRSRGMLGYGRRQSRI